MNVQPYHIPEEISEGDFREVHGGSDPNFVNALALVQRELGNEDHELVQSVYLEISRGQAAMNDVYKNHPEIASESYLGIAAFFGARIDRILHPEQFTDKP